MRRLLIAAPLALLAGAAAAQETVRLGTEGAYPPYNFLDDSGQIAGFERELGDELCARAELQCEWVTNDWDSIIPNLVSGNYDAIIAAMSITPERDDVIDFSENYTPPPPSAYAAASEGVDPQTGVIAAQTGTIQANHVTTTEATLLEFATPEEAIAAVRNGEADAVIADKDVLTPQVEALPDLAFVGEDVFLDEGIGMGFRESDAELRESFDAAIVSMKEDGSLNALIEKWLPDSETF